MKAGTVRISATIARAMVIFLNRSTKWIDRHIQSDQKAAHRISCFRANPTANEQNEQYRSEGNGQKRGKKHGERFRESQRFKESPFLTLQRKDRQKRNRDDEQAKKTTVCQLLWPLR